MDRLVMAGVRPQTVVDRPTTAWPQTSSAGGALKLKPITSCTSGYRSSLVGISGTFGAQTGLAFSGSGVSASAMVAASVTFGPFLRLAFGAGVASASSACGAGAGASTLLHGSHVTSCRPGSSGV